MVINMNFLNSLLTTKFSVFEIGMLACFGISWPVSIYKSVKSKSTQGKSVFFLLVILFGYVFGITHKILYSPDIVLILYVLNSLMITTDVLIYFKNKKREDLANSESSEQGG